jgi:hypothetical protein
MAEKFRFFDAVENEHGAHDREYNAQEFTEYFEALVTTGIMQGDKLELEVINNGSNMNSIVKPGIAFIKGRYYENTDEVILTHDTESVAFNRIDRVVIRMDTNTNARYVKAFIKKGVASANPVAPPLIQTDTVYEISLAQVRITGGQSFLTSSAITDERGTDDVICPWAGSKILPNFNNDALIALTSDFNNLTQNFNDLTQNFNNTKTDLNNHKIDTTSHIPYVVAKGSANVYTASVNGITSYVEGVGFAIKINVQNTGSSTINVNGLGAKTIIKGNGNTLSSGNLKVNGVYTLRYNGTNFILQGEGGSGTAIASDVLVGKTFTNDAGDVTGTMINRSLTTTTGTRAATGNGYMDILPPQGYYDGGNSSRVRVNDGNFNAQNIRKGVSMFGFTGTYDGQYTTASTTVTLSAISGNYITPFSFSVNMGFTPKMFGFLVTEAITAGGYYKGGAMFLFPPDSGSGYYATSGVTQWGSSDGLGSSTGTVIRFMPYDSNTGTMSYASGNYVYVKGGVSSSWGIQSQRVSIVVFAWG